jgi:hypothetical protein
MEPVGFTDWRMAPKSEVDEMSLHKLSIQLFFKKKKIVLESVRQERDELLLKAARLEENVGRLKEDLAKCQEAKK